MAIKENLLERLNSKEASTFLQAYQELSSSFKHAQENLPNTGPYNRYNGLIKKYVSKYNSLSKTFNQ